MLMLMMAYSPLLVLAVLLVGSNAADNPCETIASNTKVAQEGIRCIGRVGDDLLVMTQKMEIWMIEAKEIDKEGENKPINSLYFGNAPPVPIEEKWPEIKSWDLGVNNSDWNDLKRYTKTCNPAVDANGQYLLIDGPKDQKDDTEHNGHLWIWVEGLRWDIRKKVPHRGFTNDHDDVHARWISSSEPAKQYMFTDKDGKIRVIRYSSCNSSSNSTLDVFLDGPPMGYVNEEGKCYHVKDPPYHPLCLSGTNQVYVGPGSGDCPAGDKPAQWTIFTGFVDKGHFYLMTKDSVHIPSDKPKSTANESEFSLALLPTPTEPPLSSASNSTERSSSSQSKGRFDLEKCKLRYEIEASFARLSPIESGSDVEAVKTLLVETAKARTKLASYQKDDRLHSIIFNLAFKKLQLKMRDQFLAIYGPHLGGISLCNLVNFLQAEIVAQNAKTVNLVNKILYSKDKGQRSTFQKSMNEVLIRCKYCKSRGHVRDDCPCVKGLLCFKCYRTGHTKPTCPQYTFC